MFIKLNQNMSTVLNMITVFHIKKNLAIIKKNLSWLTYSSFYMNDKTRKDIAGKLIGICKHHKNCF